MDSARRIAASTPVPQWARLVLDDQHIYFTDAAGWTVQRVPLAGGTPTLMTSTPLEPFALAIDADELWYSTADPGKLYRYGQVDDPLLAGMLRRRTPFAVDSDRLYWSVPQHGIVSIAR